MKSDPSFAEQWQAAVTLVEVRGWNFEIESDGRTLLVWIQDGWHALTYPRDPEGLAALIHQLSLEDGVTEPRYKTLYRHAFGSNDQRVIYGTIYN